MWSDEQTRENLMTESTEATASVVETVATEPSTDIESARDAEAATLADAPHETPDPVASAPEPAADAPVSPIAPAPEPVAAAAEPTTDAEERISMDEAIEQSFPSFEPGEVIQATVVQVDRDSVLVDVGT